MDDTITQIATLRKQQRAAIKDALVNPSAETVHAILVIDKELCTALTSALETHASTLGVSDTVTEASITPKD